MGGLVEGLEATMTQRDDSVSPVMASAAEVRRTSDPTMVLLALERRGRDLAYLALNRQQVSHLAGRLRKVADDMAAAAARR